MYRAFFEGNELVPLAALATLLFVTIFAGVLVQVLGRGKRERLEPMARLPLDDDDQGGSHE